MSRPKALFTLLSMATLLLGVMPAYAEVTKRPTSELANSVVACAGTIYPTQEEIDLINEIRNAIGGSGGSCDAVAAPKRPSAPSNLVVQ